MEMPKKDIVLRTNPSEERRLFPEEDAPRCCEFSPKGSVRGQQWDANRKKHWAAKHDKKQVTYLCPFTNCYVTRRHMYDLNTHFKSSHGDLAFSQRHELPVLAELASNEQYIRPKGSAPKEWEAARVPDGALPHSRKREAEERTDEVMRRRRSDIRAEVVVERQHITPRRVVTATVVRETEDEEEDDEEEYEPTPSKRVKAWEVPKLRDPLPEEVDQLNHYLDEARETEMVVRERQEVGRKRLDEKMRTLQSELEDVKTTAAEQQRAAESLARELQERNDEIERLKRASEGRIRESNVSGKVDVLKRIRTTRGYALFPDFRNKSTLVYSLTNRDVDYLDLTSRDEVSDDCHL